MTIIKTIYDNGSNGLVNVMRTAHKNDKKLSEMTSQEIMSTCFGMIRK